VFCVRYAGELGGFLLHKGELPQQMTTRKLSSPFRKEFICVSSIVRAGGKMKMNRQINFVLAGSRSNASKKTSECLSEEENCCEYFKTHEKLFFPTRQQQNAREREKREELVGSMALCCCRSNISYRKHSASEFSHFHDVRKASSMRIFERLRRNSVAATSLA
jgi:hypothetical protein